MKTITTENFDREVTQSSLPVLLDFWAPWCTYCRRLSPVLDRLEAKLSGQVALAKLNIDEEPALAQRFDVQVIPTLYLFQNGEAGDKLVAPAAQEDILSFLEEQGVSHGL